MFKLLKGKAVQLTGFLVVALVIALGVACLKLSYERHNHLLTQTKLADVQESLQSAQRTIERLKQEAAINKEVREQLAADLLASNQRLRAIEASAKDQLDALRQEMQQELECSLPPSEGEYAVPKIDYGRRAADILVSGMWDAYQNSLRDPSDRP